MLFGCHGSAVSRRGSGLHWLFLLCDCYYCILAFCTLLLFPLSQRNSRGAKLADSTASIIALLQVARTASSDDKRAADVVRRRGWVRTRMKREGWEGDSTRLHKYTALVTPADAQQKKRANAESECEG